MDCHQELSGKVAIVTGATSGVGKATARKLALAGAQVLATGRNGARGAELVDSVSAEITEEGGVGAISFCVADLTDPSAGEELVRTALERYGSLRIVVPNAGDLGLGPLHEVSPESWRRTLALNLDSIFYLLRAALPEMVRWGEGSVVITGSIAAWKGFPGHAAYSASKGALVALTGQLAMEYGRSGIRVNLMAPGPIDTPMLRDSVVAFPNPEEILAQTAVGTALGRVGLPDEVAELALFLAGPRSSYITGASIPIDGGITAG